MGRKRDGSQVSWGNSLARLGKGFRSRFRRAVKGHETSGKDETEQPSQCDWVKELNKEMLFWRWVLYLWGEGRSEMPWNGVASL